MRIYDRETKHHEEEKQFGGALLKLLYSRAFRPVRPVFLKPGFSDVAEALLERRYDRKKLDALMAVHHIDPARFEGYPFETFSQFFLRRYKEGMLPAAAPGEVISPSDGKVTVYPITEELRVEVKGIAYTVRELLGGSDSADLFGGGLLFLIRLSLEDCHRFIYTETGPLSGRPFRKIRGLLHTVSAYSGREPVLRENERRYSIIESRNGLVGVMEVGALLVGRIRYHRVKAALRYAERGWFEPGGSTILLFYQKGAVTADPDILRETAAGNEVRVRLGERIGVYARTT